MQHLSLQVKPVDQISTLSDLQVIEYIFKISPLGRKHVLDYRALNFGCSLEFHSLATAAFKATATSATIRPIKRKRSVLL